MYEYKVIIKEFKQGFIKPNVDEKEIEQTINKMAEIGYELVTITPNAGENGRMMSYTLVFKREKK